MNFVEIIVFIFCLFSVAGCKHRPSQAKGEYKSREVLIETKVLNQLQFPIKINPLQKYEKKSLMLEDIAVVEYIPLETNKDVLLSVWPEIAMSERLIVLRNRPGSVFVFDRAGHLLHQFNHTGRGPGEYQSITHITVDFESEEIYIADYALKYKIEVYSMTGDFKRSINIPVPFWIGDFTNYDKNHLLVYMKMSPEGMKKYKDSFHPYFLMSKQDGTLKPLNIEVAEMKDGSLHQSYEVDSKHYRGRIVGYRTSPLVRNGNDFYISDFASDTIYSFIDNRLSPYIIMTPSLQNMENSWFVGIAAKTSRYTFLSVVGAKKETMELSRRFIGIDHQTGEIFEPDFHSHYFVGNLENYFYSLPQECTVLSIPAIKLVEAYQEEKVTGKLKEIASQVKEDDNPIIVFIKFRK